MNCPHDERPLSINERHAYTRHECRKCSGMLMDAAFLAHAFSRLKKADAGEPNLLALPEGQIACPREGRRMRALLHLDVEIDICPDCRSVWLDRGEYDKVLAAGRKKEEDGAPHRRTRRASEMSDGDSAMDLEDVATFIRDAADVASSLWSS